MHFCPNCKFMVYTKLKDDTKSLINYCKNCNWSGNIVNKDNCIYRRNYQEDYIADKVISNKYTIFDATLPRVTYSCVNDGCPTNRTDIETSKSFLIENIPADLSDDQVKQIFDDDADKISLILRIKLVSVLIVTNSNKDKTTLWSKYNSFVFDDNKLTCTEYTTPKNEVIYIKYDSINMRYLYICSNCGTSWKKN